MSLIDKKTIELGEGLFIDCDPKLDSVTVRIGEEKKTIKKVDLWAATFAIADPETQERLMPVRQTEMVTYTKIHSVKLKKDLRAGEIVRVKCEISVPETVNEGLAGSLRDRQRTSKSGIIMLPKSGVM